MPALRIRPMSRAELALGIEWAAQEGWNPGLHDADSFHAADPGGFLLGELEGGEPVGMISAVRYGQGFGFIGFYLVRPAFRGQGHGLALWRAGMQQLAGRVVGLDGVVAQQENYRRSGFALAWNNVRYQGVVPAGLRDAVAARGAASANEVVPLEAIAPEDLLDHDAALFPDDRRRFTRHWIAQPGSTVRALRREGRLAGYGVIRPCRVGHKIGPLFADDAPAAEALFRALVATLPPGGPVVLDVPAPHEQAVALAHSHGLQPVFETARMYVGAAPTLPLQRLFGVTSFELG
jgi:Acetyltransferase (GNAT) domain/Acetyltransferase (GNAT) family